MTILLNDIEWPPCMRKVHFDLIIKVIDFTFQRVMDRMNFFFELTILLILMLNSFKKKLHGNISVHISIPPKKNPITHPPLDELTYLNTVSEGTSHFDIVLY